MKTSFFSENYEEFRRFSDLLDAYSPEKEEEQKLIELVKAGMSAISLSREEYDFLTPYSTRHHGPSLLDGINRLLKYPPHQ